jgi:hypothetical protein
LLPILSLCVATCTLVVTGRTDRYGGPPVAFGARPQLLADAMICMRDNLLRTLANSINFGVENCYGRSLPL